MEAFTLIGKTGLDNIKNYSIEDLMIILSTDLSEYILVSGYIDLKIIPTNKALFIVVGKKYYKKHIGGELNDFICEIQKLNPNVTVMLYCDITDVPYNKEIKTIRKTHNANDDYKIILEMALIN